MTDDKKMMSDLEWTVKIAEDAANFSRLKDAFEVIAARYSDYAKQYRMYFVALTGEGFTPEQAIQIIRAHGWIPR